MTQRPCVDCGVPSPSTRCTEHEREFGRRESRRNTEHVAFRNLARWRNLSKRVRRMQPWCSGCGTSERLQCNHVVPVSERPDLTYVQENLSILCASCNAARGDSCTDEERADVMRRIAVRKQRRVGLTTWGVGVGRDRPATPDKAASAIDTPGGSP